MRVWNLSNIKQTVKVKTPNTSPIKQNKVMWNYVQYQYKKPTVNRVKRLQYVITI
jgi:hypothetical protein